jgi:hypothetical protein
VDGDPASFSSRYLQSDLLRFVMRKPFTMQDVK